ncbi:MAG TPA: MBL fold metallo-hydrolase [Phycisphaerae bacterium]|nr:MBL fold metallo-hydrolase [Phycisphaerae bacterium]
MHILIHDGMRVSLDCGLYQGRRIECRELNQEYPVSPRKLDAVVLSHAHIDHSGRLPGLVKRGFGGPVYATPATRDLCGILLPDSAHIQEEDARYWNRKHPRSEWIEPLYELDDAAKALERFEPVSYDTDFQVGRDLRVRFIEAGHILGSAMALAEIRTNGATRRILFTGDVGRFGLPILRDPTEPLPECDYLITECTYANRRHDNPTDMKDKLCRIIAETRQAGGKVIIPAFSVGRTQTIIYFILQLFTEGRLAELPVYVDSPLSTRATEVFGNHPEVYDREALRNWGREGDLFGLDGGPVRYITDVDDSKALNYRDEPCVILSASGMCEVGRILHHLKNHIEDDRNTVVIVGFMAQHTLGRRIVERREELKIFGKLYRMLARVEVLNGFSAHADAEEFRRLYTPLARRLRRAFVVHGEDSQPPAMKAMLEELGCRDVVIPDPADRFEI